MLIRDVFMLIRDVLTRGGFIGSVVKGWVDRRDMREDLPAR